tara:strand:+ start:1755 stop:1955 length:201 start_codon:yes stop_codon:yes gene_type:complete
MFLQAGDRKEWEIKNDQADKIKANIVEFLMKGVATKEQFLNEEVKNEVENKVKEFCGMGDLLQNDM